MKKVTLNKIYKSLKKFEGRTVNVYDVYKLIEGAVEAAAPGEKVRISPNTYTEDNFDTYFTVNIDNTPGHEVYFMINYGYFTTYHIAEVRILNYN